MVNWSALGVLVGLATMLITIMGFVFMSGRMTERLNEHATRLDTHDDVLNAHAAKLNEHALAIVKMDSWKDGFNAGARSAGQEP
jgi:hypothetical protein